MAQTVVTRSGRELEVENLAVATGAGYADILNLDLRNYSQGAVITLVEVGAAQSFKYKILASLKSGTTQPVNSDSSYVVLASDVTVALSAKAYEILAGAWKWVIVQVINGSGAASVNARARAVA